MADECGDLRYSALTLMGNHASFAGLIAGFAITGLVLTVTLAAVQQDQGAAVESGEGADQAADAQTSKDRAITATALFASSAIVGVLTAYLFSASTGDPCLLAQTEMVYPSALLATSALLMVAAIGATIATVPELAETARAVQRFLFAAVGLLFVRLALDGAEAAALGRSLDAHDGSVLPKSGVPPVTTAAIWCLGICSAGLVYGPILARHLPGRIGESALARYVSEWRNALYGGDLGKWRNRLGLVSVFGAVVVLVAFSWETGSAQEWLTPRTFRPVLAVGYFSAVSALLLALPERTVPKRIQSADAGHS